jgi:hypothetical protein
MPADTILVYPSPCRLIVSLDDWFEFRNHICLVFDLLGPRYRGDVLATGLQVLLAIE